MSNGIYLDNHATTPVDPRAFDAMMPCFMDVYGNASSIDHIYGNTARKAVDDARATITKVFGGRRDTEIIFTSGATESNNLALKGAYRMLHGKGKGNHIISTVIEHPCILETLIYLEKNEGAVVTLLDVDQFGMVSVDDFKNAIEDTTILASVMFANNEIGTIQPIKELGAIAKNNGVLFHTDAAQAAGHEAIDVYDMNIDLMSFSAHKFYGPKGVGGLFVRSFKPMVRLEPIIHGGGQERGFRSGTINVPGIVGMAKALEIANKERNTEQKRLGLLRDRIYQSLLATLPQIQLNGHPELRLSHNLNITIPGVESKALMHSLRGKLSFSAGSACSTVKVKASHVLLAIGREEEETYQTIRLGLGRTITDEQVDEVIEELLGALKQLCQSQDAV